MTREHQHMTDKFEQMAREIVGRMFRAEETPVDIITTALRTVDEAAFKRGRDAGLEEAANSCVSREKELRKRIGKRTGTDWKAGRGQIAAAANEAEHIAELCRALKERTDG